VDERIGELARRRTEAELAAAGLAPTSIDGLPVDPSTGLPAAPPNSSSNDVNTPGCDLPTRWSETNQTNAAMLCTKHNNTKHRYELHPKRATNGIDNTTQPNPTILLPIGARTPQLDQDDPPDDPNETRREEHLPRERLRAWSSDQAA
jgi:hypothetical protein